MSTNNRQRMLAHLGRLAKQRRGQMTTLGRVPFSESKGFSEASLKTFELGHTEPQTVNKAKFERALGWKPGIISVVLDLAEAGKVDPSGIDMAYLDGRVAPEPAKHAGELGDIELLTEVIRRLERYRDALDDPTVTEATATTPAQEQWQGLKLAASEDKTLGPKTSGPKKRKN